MNGVIGHDALHRVPKTGAVVHHPQMAELVGHHIVDDRGFVVNEPPIQANRPIGTGTAPARAGTAEAQPCPGHTELRRKVVELVSAMAGDEMAA